MSGALARRAASLRDSFDRSFAAALQDGAPEVEDFLAIRVEDAPYAIRLADIAALAASPGITAIPGQPAALLGLAGFRDAILPVYALAALLGHGIAEPPRWLLRAPQVAFACSRLDGHLRLPAGLILPQPAATPARRHVRGFLQTDDLIRPVLDMASLLEAVRAVSGATMNATMKEQDPV